MRKKAPINTFMLIIFSLFFMSVPIVVSIVTMARPGPGNMPRVHVDTSSLFFQIPWLRFALQQAILLALFYLNYFYLVPRFLIRSRQWLAYISILLLLGIACFLSVHFLHRTIDLSIGFNPMPMRIRFLHVILHLLMALVISLMWRFLLENHRLQQMQRQILHEKSQAELQFLQSQINPHFLLNTLNTLYSLSVKESKETPGLILKLSEMLKFTLYESGRKSVPLEKELNYIIDYVDIQSFRLHEKTSVYLEIKGTSEGLFIHPMLLIPFIENAFKHGTSTRQEARIDIQIDVLENVLNLKLRNQAFVRSNPVKPEESGIGLENVQKRLDLLYPERYSLEIINDNTYFTVQLMLLLSHDEMSGT